PTARSSALSFSATPMQSVTSARYVAKRPGWGIPIRKAEGLLRSAKVTVGGDPETPLAGAPRFRPDFPDFVLLPILGHQPSRADRQHRRLVPQHRQSIQVQRRRVLPLLSAVSADLFAGGPDCH